MGESTPIVSMLLPVPAYRHNMSSKKEIILCDRDSIYIIFWITNLYLTHPWNCNYNKKTIREKKTS